MGGEHIGVTHEHEHFMWPLGLLHACMGMHSFACVFPPGEGSGGRSSAQAGRWAAVRCTPENPPL